LVIQEAHAYNIAQAKVGLLYLAHQRLDFWPSFSNLALANRGFSGQAGVRNNSPQTFACATPLAASK